MNLLIILSAIKTILIVILLYKLSHIFLPLRILFMNKMLTFAVFQFLHGSILNGTLDVNGMPYVGCVFIMIDAIVLRIIKQIVKN